MSNIQEERLKNYISAEKKALESQEYQVNGQRTKRADLSQISTGINDLLSTGAGGSSFGRSKRIILRDLWGK